jgi:Cd2+/Zn2+-exporting ATPase
VAHGRDVLPPDAEQFAISDFEARTGRGIIAKVNGRELRVGTPALFAEPATPKRLVELQQAGKTVVLVGDGERVRGLIALADAPRTQAKTVLQRLRRMGVHERIMLTGDHERVARSVADALGIEKVLAGLLPEDKVRAIEDLKREHGTVSMLGDGVNDAPALATADVGIAMGAAGSPATIETADIALMADDIAMLPYAVRVSKLARRLVRFNIGLALGLKLVLAVGAVSGVVTLLVAVLLGDLGASLAVTLNAMRLARTTP